MQSYARSAALFALNLHVSAQRLRSVPQVGESAARRNRVLVEAAPIISDSQDKITPTLRNVNDHVLRSGVAGNVVIKSRPCVN